MGTPVRERLKSAVKKFNFRIERNQAFDIIQNLKTLIKTYDDPTKADSRYISVPLVGNEQLQIDVVIDRKYKPGIKVAPMKIPFYKRLFAKKKG